MDEILYGGGNSMRKNILAIGIVFLFIVSSITPMVFGYHVETTTFDSELEKQLDILRFMCTSPYGLDEERYNYYKEKLLSQYASDNSNDDMVCEPEQEESKIPVVLPQVTMVGGPMDSAWPMFAHDVHHTSQSPYSTAHIDGLEKWRFYTGDWIEGGIVIDSDGIIYFLSGRYLYALNPNGTLKWNYKLGGITLWDTPAIAEDGTIYAGCWDTRLYAINPNGTLKWKTVGTGGSIASSLAIGDDGTIYFGHVDNSIVAVNSNGTIKWSYKTGSNIFSDPAIGYDGIIYIGSNDKYLYAMYSNGTLKWRFYTGKEVAGAASIADDGTIYAYGTWGSPLYALYPNGTVKWECGISGKVNSNPSIGSDGTIYIGNEGYICAIYSNGTVKWRLYMGAERWVGGSCPAISADGTIYIGTNVGIPTSSGGEIIAVNPDGSERWRKRISDKSAKSPPSIAEDGTVYIGSSGRGYLHAFGPQETNEPPEAPTIRSTYYDFTFGVTGSEYWYTFVAHDPDNNLIELFVDWGDGNSGWVDWFASGENMYAPHTWKKKGTYTIKAKVKDVFGEESNWGYFTFKAVNGKSCILMGEIKDFEPLYKYGQWRAKAKSLWIIQFFPFSIKKYTSGEQFYFYRGLSIIEMDWLFGFFLIWWDQ
jgi:outer membrane protein assembly factor BamB